ncbi:MAG: restriction endonuclease subunit S [Pseudomonadota bacterium]
MSAGVPKGWQMSCLEELATAIGGGTPSKSDPKYWTNGKIPWVSPKDMKRAIVTDAEDHVTEAALNHLSVVPPESILVVVRSGILSRTLPVAQTKVPVTVNQDMRAFVPRPNISTPYVAWQLIAKERGILDACSKDGTTVASIEGPALARFPLAVAPAAEQTRIVAKLEELLSELDAGVAELKAAQKKLQQYRQSLLKAAVEGALTADWRAARAAAPTRNAKSAPAQTPADNETGAQLLARILRERRARWEQKQLAKFKDQGKTPPKDWQSKYPEPVAPDTTGLPELPEGWVWASLDQLSEFITSGSRGWAEYYAPSGATFIRSQNINKDWLDLSDIAFVNPPMSSEGIRTKVQRHDLLLTITGANVGKAAHVKTEMDEAYVSQHVALIRIIECALAEYLHLFLTASAGGRGQLDKEAYGAGKPGLNLQQVAAVTIPLTGTAEREEMMQELAIQLEATASQVAAIEFAFSQSTAQRQTILRAAFAGQLVPQDPNDEPAPVLLERIRTERAASFAIKKSRGRKNTSGNRP